MRIALDAMGGDHAPGINLDGAAEALRSHDDLTIDLVGDAETLQQSIRAHESSAELSSDRVRVVAAEGFVGMDEKPTVALRTKPNASITVCWRQLAAGEVDAVVSAGNTGAVVASGLRTRLYLPGVKRPGIAVALPTMKGQCVLMDAGANPACKPEHLDQYARMGAVYVRAALGVETPRVGLVNIGGEIGKGNELVNETHTMLTDSGRSLASIGAEYVGNVEGRELFEGAADVVICDGFVGNVILKSAEGFASMMLQQFAGRVLPKLDVDQQQAGRVMHEFAAGYKYAETGGAPLLGVDGICLIAHGSSDGHAIGNAIKMATKLASADLNTQLTEAIG